MVFGPADASQDRLTRGCLPPREQTARSEIILPASRVIINELFVRASERAKLIPAVPVIGKKSRRLQIMKDNPCRPHPGDTFYHPSGTHCRGFVVAEEA